MLHPQCSLWNDEALGAKAVVGRGPKWNSAYSPIKAWVGPDQWSGMYYIPQVNGLFLKVFMCGDYTYSVSAHNVKPV